MEKPPYTDTIRVDFKDWPHLIPEKLRTDVGGPIGAIRGASSRRIFNLERNWEVEIGVLNNRYEATINGIIIIPISYNSIKTRLDGASVPLPWLVSFLSFGVFRPLGVMLLASIVHDFAFVHGGLLYKNEEETQEPRFEPVDRVIADKLFCDIIRTVNNMKYTAFLAWLAVRLGWFCIPYAEKSPERKMSPRKGEFPIIAFMTLLVVLSLLGTLITFYGIKTVTFVFIAIYLSIFLMLQFVASSTK